MIGNTAPMIDLAARWGGLLRLAGFFATTLVADAGAAEQSSRGAEIKQVVYMYSVTEYCGLNTQEVHAGYRSQMRELTRQGRLPESTVRWLRIHGMLAADLEYGDRGLGGHRNWCRTEGLDAAHHFLTYGNAPSSP